MRTRLHQRFKGKFEELGEFVFCLKKDFYLKVLISTLLAFVSSASMARNKSSIRLRDSGQLKIDFNKCVQLENQIGQLLYANVDGFGDMPDGKAIHPLYIDMVKDLQIGGVLPKPKKRSNFQDIRRDLLRLRVMTDHPLLLGVDFVQLKSFEFGQGYMSGQFNNKLWRQRNSKAWIDSGNICLDNWIELDSIFHQAIGLNHSLGPTMEYPMKTKRYFEESNRKLEFKIEPTNIEDFLSLFQRKWGTFATLKHFPYSVTSYDLHKMTRDESIPWKEIEPYLEVFKESLPQADFLMTTHIYNSAIDPLNLVTFSKKWIDLVRGHFNFDGIILTDALWMLEAYEDTIKQMSSRWPQDQVRLSSIQSIFAARSILAGHDMVLVVETLPETYRTFNDLLRVACSNTSIGNSLKNRISESFERITKFKQKNYDALSSSLSLSKNEIDRISNEYNSHDECRDPKKTKNFINSISR